MHRYSNVYVIGKLRIYTTHLFLFQRVKLICVSDVVLDELARFEVYHASRKSLHDVENNARRSTSEIAVLPMNADYFEQLSTVKYSERQTTPATILSCGLCFAVIRVSNIGRVAIKSVLALSLIHI